MRIIDESFYEMSKQLELNINSVLVHPSQLQRCAVFVIINSERIMNNSKLMTYTYTASIFACCYVKETIMAFATAKSVILWDFVNNKHVASMDFLANISPVGLQIISSDNQVYLIHLQEKSGQITIIEYQVDKPLIKRHHYSVDMMGFTKLTLTKHFYDEHGEFVTKVGNTFYSLHYTKIIQKRDIESGNIMGKFVSEECQFGDVNCLLNYQINKKEYLLLIQEGATVKQFILPEIQESQTQIDLNFKLTIPSKEQIKIVLSIQALSGFRAIVCLRNDQMTIINLINLSVDHHIQCSNFRLVKMMPNIKQEILAVSGKNQIGFISKQKLLSSDKIHSKLIMDMDVCQYGILGVTQEGKIWFLPSM